MPPFTESWLAEELVPPMLALTREIPAPPVRYIPFRAVLLPMRYRRFTSGENVRMWSPPPLIYPRVKRGSNDSAPLDTNPNRTSTGVPMLTLPQSTLQPLPSLLYTMPRSTPSSCLASICWATAAAGTPARDATSTALPISCRILIPPEDGSVRVQFG